MHEISVIVPVYKVEHYIHRCVDSILAQSFTDFQLILVDDGSPDNCGEICDEYAEKDSRIHVIHKTNGGLSSARNAGLDWVFANSNSEYISFVDSDDWVHSLYLELLYDAAVRFSVKICQCGFYKTEGPVENISSGREMTCVCPEEQYIRWYDPYAWGKLYHRSCFKTIRYPVGILFEDVSIWYKILFSVDKIAIVDEPLYYYYQRSDSIVNSAWTPAKYAQVDAWGEQLRFLEKYGNERVLRCAVRHFFEVLSGQLTAVEKSD